MALGTRVYSRYAAFHIFMFFSLACLGLKSNIDYIRTHTITTINHNAPNCWRSTPTGSPPSPCHR